MIKKILEWALSKFEDKTPKIEAWPFPVEQAPKAKHAEGVVVRVLGMESRISFKIINLLYKD